jgi:hypothetical protein
MTCLSKLNITKQITKKYRLLFNGTLTERNTMMYESHIHHIWKNASINQRCMWRVVEVYWIDHKPIYFTFKISNYVSQYYCILKKIKHFFKNLWRKEKIMVINWTCIDLWTSFTITIATTFMHARAKTLCG